MLDKVRTHKDLDVWKKAVELAEELYAITAQFPQVELYGLASQARRSAVSIPSNIAEGAALHCVGFGCRIRDTTYTGSAHGITA
jgi:hypothetical protein